MAVSKEDNILVKLMKKIKKSKRTTHYLIKPPMIHKNPMDIHS